MTGLDFLSRFFYIALPFAPHPVKERKTDPVIGLKNKWFVNGKGCKKYLSQTGLDVFSGKKGS
jgi:hypothetical protein